MAWNKNYSRSNRTRVHTSGHRRAIPDVDVRKPSKTPWGELKRIAVKESGDKQWDFYFNMRKQCHEARG